MLQILASELILNQNEKYIFLEFDYIQQYTFSYTFVNKIMNEKERRKHTSDCSGQNTSLFSTKKHPTNSQETMYIQ